MAHVTCTCGWMGRRVRRGCECYEPCACAGLGYGHCPKCGAAVEPARARKAREVASAQADAWLKSEEGQRALSELADVTKETK
jgi:hypothetical protein